MRVIYCFLIFSLALISIAQDKLVYYEAIKNATLELGLKKSAKMHKARGDAYSFIGQYENALKDYDSALTINSKYSEAYLNKAIIYYELKNLDLAEKNCKLSIKANSINPDAYFLLGNICKTKKNYDCAINHYTTALKFDSENKMYLYNTALCYYEKNDYVNSEKFFSSVILLDKNDINSYLKRGLVFAKLKKREEAIKDIKTAFEFDKDYNLNNKYAGLIYLEFGEKEKACQYFKKAFDGGVSDIQKFLNECK